MEIPPGNESVVVKGIADMILSSLAAISANYEKLKQNRTLSPSIEDAALYLPRIKETIAGILEMIAPLKSVEYTFTTICTTLERCYVDAKHIEYFLSDLGSDLVSGLSTEEDGPQLQIRTTHIFEELVIGLLEFVLSVRSRMEDACRGEYIISILQTQSRGDELVICF